MFGVQQQIKMQGFGVGEGTEGDREQAENPAQAVLQGIKEIISQASDLGHIQYQLNITHGSTVATNILLERNGAEMALLTTQNFEDLIEIGRQNRAELYNFDVDQPEPLVPSSRRYGVAERMLHTGQPQTAW